MIARNSKQIRQQAQNFAFILAPPPGKYWELNSNEKKKKQTNKTPNMERKVAAGSKFRMSFQSVDTYLSEAVPTTSVR